MNELERDETLTADQVGEWLHLDRQTVNRKALRKELPGFKLPGGKAWLFQRSVIERHLRECSGQEAAA